MSDKTRDKLLPCPFCGGEARMEKKLFDTKSVVTMHFRAACMECGSNNDWYTDKGYAIKVWNTRKPIERIVERLKAEILEQLSDCGDDWFTAEKINKAIDIVKEEGAV